MTKDKYARGKDVRVAVDIVVLGLIGDRLNVLLIKPTKPELAGSWALPGGLLKYGMGLEERAEEVLNDKTGVHGALLDQLATFGDPARDPFGHVVSVAYIALVNIEDHILRTTAENSEVAWFDVNKLPKFAYDHKEIMGVALRRLRAKLEYTNIARGMLNKSFTLSELQGVYERVLGTELDKRNFRKKVLSIGMIQETGEMYRGGNSRPAKLYKFKDKSIKEYDIL